MYMTRYLLCWYREHPYEDECLYLLRPTETGSPDDSSGTAAYMTFATGMPITWPWLWFFILSSDLWVSSSSWDLVSLRNVCWVYRQKRSQASYKVKLHEKLVAMFKAIVAAWITTLCFRVIIMVLPTMLRKGAETKKKLTLLLSTWLFFFNQYAKQTKPFP